MKKLLTVALVMASFTAMAQQNTLLDQSFWRNAPDVEAVKAEVAKGNDPTQANAMAMDPVVMAINAGAPIASIKYLLNQPGANVDRLTHDGRTYLHWAAQRGNVEVMAYLLDKGAKPNIVDSHGTTPLLAAAAGAQQDTRIYDLLAAHGADLKKELNPDGANALLLAIGNDKDFALTNYFVSKGLNIKSTDANGNNAFSYAAKTGNIDLMKALIQKGVQVNQQAMLMAAQGGGRRGGFGGPGGGQAAFGGQGGGAQANGMAANNTRDNAGARAQGGFGGSAGIGLPVYQYLESLGIKPTAISNTGQNVLHYLARKQGQNDIIQYFLAKGVDAGLADEDGFTPLMYAAAANRDTTVLALLLPRVKNIDQANLQGQTALTLAVKSNSSQVVGYLLNKGANAKVTDRKGNDLVFYAIDSYGGERRSGGNPDELDAKLNLLKAKGLDITKPQANGNTLYHLAVAKNDLSLVQHLQPLGIDVNAKNKEGITALHKAAMIAKDDALMKYLISIGAKKDTGTSFNETAFDLASQNETLTKNKVSVNFLK